MTQRTPESALPHDVCKRTAENLSVVGHSPEELAAAVERRTDTSERSEEHVDDRADRDHDNACRKQTPHGPLPLRLDALLGPSSPQAYISPHNWPGTTKVAMRPMIHIAPAIPWLYEALVPRVMVAPKIAAKPVSASTRATNLGNPRVILCGTLVEGMCRES